MCFFGRWISGTDEDKLETFGSNAYKMDKFELN